jgi:hypothetical protein
MNKNNDKWRTDLLISYFEHRFAALICIYLYVKDTILLKVDIKNRQSCFIESNFSCDIKNKSSEIINIIIIGTKFRIIFSTTKLR